jgi:hypothetical protein
VRYVEMAALELFTEVSSEHMLGAAENNLTLNDVQKMFVLRRILVLFLRYQLVKAAEITHIDPITMQEFC